MKKVLRRDFLKTGIACSLALRVPVVGSAPNKRANRKKNIVFITADQLPASFIGCYGSGVNSTPVIDKLAEKGARFTSNYTTSPVCAPNRATWLTGRSPVVNGIIVNNYALSTDSPTYAHVLQQNGYRTGAFGKIHQTPMHLANPGHVDFLGFDESTVTEDPKWGPWIDWIQKEHPEQYDTALAFAWANGNNRPWHFSKNRSEEQLVKAIKMQGKTLKPLKEKSEWSLFWPSPLSAEAHDTTFITDKSIDFMQRHLQHHADQPFFCHVSYVDPHDPYNPPKPYDTMFKAEDMPEPAPAEWLNQGFEALEEHRRWHGFDKIAKDTKTIQKMRALYHGSIKLMDDQIGRIIDFLEENNLWENTILVFSTDHGDMMGDHELITKTVMHYDNSIRCPLIVVGPGIKTQVSDRLTCSLDFFPTFCEWAKVEKDYIPPLEGKSFAKTCAGEPEQDQWSEISVAYEQAVSIITEDGWRLTRYTEDNKGQMFDLKNDRAEQNNLYNDLRYATKRLELYERLVDISTRPHRVPHYRNMPVVDGKKYQPVKMKLKVATYHYQTKESPALTGNLE